MVTPKRAPIAEAASGSQRLRVVHGNIEWTQALTGTGRLLLVTPEQMLRRGWFVHDPRHWSYSVWMITNDNPFCKLAADSIVNQGSDSESELAHWQGAAAAGQLY